MREDFTLRQGRNNQVSITNLQAPLEQKENHVGRL